MAYVPYLLELKSRISHRERGKIKRSWKQNLLLRSVQQVRKVLKPPSGFGDGTLSRIFGNIKFHILITKCRWAKISNFTCFSIICWQSVSSGAYFCKVERASRDLEWQSRRNHATGRFCNMLKSQTVGIIFTWKYYRVVTICRLLYVTTSRLCRWIALLK